MYKMIHEIFSMPRADSGYLHNFEVNSWVFKDDESKTEAKTNSGYRECPALDMYRTCTKFAFGMLCKYMHMHAHTHTPPYMKL